VTGKIYCYIDYLQIELHEWVRYCS
jgi:hypothetical protein